MRAYSKKDVDKKALKGARIAVLGYGSQGRAHALNLQGLAASTSSSATAAAARAGRGPRRTASRSPSPPTRSRARPSWRCWRPTSPSRVSTRTIEKTLPEGAAILFAHGFNIHFKQIKPRKDLDVVLIAPKGPGDLVRRQYQQGRGVPCLIAVAQDATGKAQARALAYADGIGGTRAGVHRDDLRRGDRDRPVRRAGRALRRRHRAGAEGLRDAGGGRLPA